MEKDNTTLVALLLGRGAEVYIRDGSGQTAMNLILERQHDEVLNLVANKTISALAETKAQLEQRLDARDLYDDLPGASQLGLLPLPFPLFVGLRDSGAKLTIADAYTVLAQDRTANSPQTPETELRRRGPRSIEPAPPTGSESGTGTGSGLGMHAAATPHQLCVLKFAIHGQIRAWCSTPGGFTIRCPLMT